LVSILLSILVSFWVYMAGYVVHEVVVQRWYPGHGAPTN